MRPPESLSGNARIGAALIDVLGQAGDGGARARVRTALGDEGRRPQAEPWIKDATLSAMWEASGADDRVARRVGRELMAPGSVGLFFAYAGVATVEKAYRRCDQWLPREQRDARYACEAIDPGEAVLTFTPPEGVVRERVDGHGCALRRGLLEGVPGLFGLLPAQVDEIHCVLRGDDVCRYHVRWSKNPRHGMWMALGGAVLFAVAFGAGLWAGGVVPGPMGAAAFAGAAVGFVALSAAAGRSTDLARQLHAVAGARRGQLALLDQADSELAERIDEMARVDSAREVVESAATPRGILGPRDDSAANEDVMERHRALVAGVADELKASTAALREVTEGLQQSLRVEEGAPEVDLRALVDEAACEVERLESLRTELARDVREAGFALRARADVGSLVRQAVALLGSRHSGAPLELAIDPELPAIRCDAFQIEQLTLQLLENALEASRQSGGTASCYVCAVPAGIELIFEDEGPGLDEEMVDVTFDPFEGAGDGAGRAGSSADFGLTVAYRIVQQHGGELRMENRPGQGTRVTAVLPGDDRPASG